MITNGMDFFIDELDNGINEVIIAENEISEDNNSVTNNNDCNDFMFGIVLSPDDNSYLSETTMAMTDSETESNTPFCDKIIMKSENETFRDISNDNLISLRPRKTLKKQSPTVEIKPKTSQNLKRKHNSTVVTIPSDYYVGRLLWAKVKSHPWWPCMIFHSPENIFYRELAHKKMIHVAYFGPSVERSWISVKDIMPFDGKDKFDEYVKQLHENNTPKHLIQQYTVSSSKLSDFNDACMEADGAKLLSVEDRIKTHGISYTKLNGESSSSEESEEEENKEEVNMEKESTTSENLETSLKQSRASLQPDIKSEPSKKPKLTESDKIINKFRYEFERLKLPLFSNSKRVSLCFLCLQEGGDLDTDVVTNCAGGCGQQFHADCIKPLFGFLTSQDATTKEINYSKCVDCNRNIRRCFVCQKIGKSDQKKDEMMKCSSGNCSRWYHSSCLYNGPYQQMITYSRSGSLLCPSHTCHACHIDDPTTVKPSSSYARCLMCPAAFHRGEWCIPAGSKEINSSYVICPQHLPMGGSPDISTAPFMDCIKNGVVTLKSIHFKISSFNDVQNKDLWVLEKPLKAHKAKPHNVTWCFLCSKDGNLICCEKCPASFHENCADIKEIPEYFICEECHLGKYPRYGEICWLKIGNYRWWPGQIVHPNNAPKNVLKASHGEGQFLVQFFGSNDYHWMNKTHAFSFEEGDDLTEAKKTGENSSGDETSEESSDDVGGSKKIDKQFQKSLKIAAKAVVERQNKWLLIFDVKSKPDRYRSIKTNVPIGNVRINKIADISHVPQCECRPDNDRNNRDPCGKTSDCVNRELMYECHPRICRNGDECHNQRFMRREYPKQEVFLTEDRGWALKTLESLKKGDFVNEYVGELIDEPEAIRRLKKSHESNITNFYMMELDGPRIIDAGPAGNMSRFMNHSCSPNLYTEKWTVNGDTRIGLFALHDIEAGEELTFNYNFFSLGKTKITCKCGSSNCSGLLGVPPKISSDIINSEKDANFDIKKSQNDRKSMSTQRKSSMNKKPTTIIEIAQESVKNKITDEECYRCGRSDCDITCSHKFCPRIYHLECIGVKKKSDNKWLCPWHYCDDCGRFSEKFCSQCTTSFCNLHVFDRLTKISDEYLLCSSHEDLFLSHGSPTESQTGSTNATFSITGTDSLPSVSI